MNSKRILTIAAIVLIPAAIIIGLVVNKGKLDEAKKPVDRSNIAVKVIVDTASYKTIDGSFSLPATVASQEDANISSETSGKIISLNIELGTAVRKGQIIGRIDATETQQKLEAAELSISKLTADYERAKILASGNATNANAVSDAKYNLDSKKLEAAQLRTQISKANIVAPISGIVVDKQKVVGEYINMGTVVGAISNIQTIKINVSTPENQAINIKKGRKAAITSDAYPEKTFSGTVNFISPKGDENHNYTVQLQLINNGEVQLKSGMYVNVQFPGTSSKQSLLMIDKNALAEGVKTPVVYVYKNGTAEERKLVLGVESDNYIEVIKGLSAGDLVVTSGQVNLSNGTKVEIIRTK